MSESNGGIMADWYIPHNKREKVAFLKARYPDCRWETMRAKQVTAVYLRVMKQEQEAEKGGRICR